jgi:hypothetical protein
MELRQKRRQLGDYPVEKQWKPCSFRPWPPSLALCDEMPCRDAGLGLVFSGKRR